MPNASATAGTRVGKVMSTDRCGTPSAASASPATAIASTSAAGPAGADQLGADLADLALGSDLRALDPQAPGRHSSTAAAARALPSRVAAMRAICGVMSARTPTMRCEPGSIVRKVAVAIAAPAPENSVSSNSTSGGLTRS